MENCKTAATPMNPSAKLTKPREGEEAIDLQKHKSAVGGLIYFSVATRPDATYAVNTAVKYTAKPSSQHWTEVKQILKGTSLTVYSDADWAGDDDDHKSTSVCAPTLNQGAVSN